MKVCTFSCEFKLDDYLNLFLTDGLHNKNKIKIILTFQLFFGNQKNPKEAVTGKENLPGEYLRQLIIKLLLLLAWWTMEITKTYKNRSTTI